MLLHDHLDDDLLEMMLLPFLVQHRSEHLSKTKTLSYQTFSPIIGKKQGSPPANMQHIYMILRGATWEE